MRKRILVVLAVIAVLCLVPMAVAAQSQVIKIATQSPLSGGMSAVGTDIKNGAQLAVEQLSGPLAKLGFKVELAPFDDQGNPDTGVANAKSIVADPGHPRRSSATTIPASRSPPPRSTTPPASSTSRPPTPTPRSPSAATPKSTASAAATTSRAP